MPRTRQQIKAYEPPPSNRIAVSSVPVDECIRFSFKHLDLRHHQFPIRSRSCTKAYFIKLLERLQAVCTMETEQFKKLYNDTIRNHPIRWEETTKPNGFDHLNEQLRGCEPYQFAITRNKHGRVYGFVIDFTFYIVWLDPQHLLYSKKRTSRR